MTLIMILFQSNNISNPIVELLLAFGFWHWIEVIFAYKLYRLLYDFYLLYQRHVETNDKKMDVINNILKMAEEHNEEKITIFKNLINKVLIFWGVLFISMATCKEAKAPPLKQKRYITASMNIVPKIGNSNGTTIRPITDKTLWEDICKWVSPKTKK